MRTQISWQVELSVKPGELDNFRALTGEMVAWTREEQGVIDYERYVSEDGETVHVYERYVDSHAAVAHLRAFREEFGNRFGSMVGRKRFTVYGNPSDELRQILDGFGAVYLAPFDGLPQCADR